MAVRLPRRAGGSRDLGRIGKNGEVGDLSWRLWTRRWMVRGWFLSGWCVYSLPVVSAASYRGSDPHLAMKRW
ncbi:hypothetical protein GCM10010317_100120 [Streptomyces mirabilis]|nr:hypothetical protein GCM10010317_100120 [Streptomyces mirabilis]